MKANKMLVFALLAALVGGCTPSGGGDSAAKTNKVEASAVVIGMENSKWAGSCPGAHVDATNMYREFSNRFTDVALFEDAKATKSAVKAALTKAAQSDFMVLFYSGHGGSEAFKDTGPEEIDGHDEFLCLYDTYLRDNELWSIISSAKGKVWLIFDCCHSETMFRSVGFSMKMVEASALADSGVNMLCWSGCSDANYSYGDSGGGKFTSAFFRRLNTNYTYDEMWKKLESDHELKSYQIIKRTKIGTKFDKVNIFK